MGRQPQFSRGLRRINPGTAPPRRFIAMAMEFAMMTAAKRDGELVANFAAQCAALGKAQVVGVAGLPAAEQAGLLRDEPEVIAVADTPWLREGEGGFVDGPSLLRPALARSLYRDGLGRVFCGGGGRRGLNRCGLPLCSWRQRCEPCFERLFDVERVLFR